MFLSPQKIQKEVDGKLDDVDSLDSLGLYLMQRCHDNDAVLVQEELDGFHHYHNELLARLASFQQTLHEKTVEQVCVKRSVRKKHF